MGAACRRTAKDYLALGKRQGLVTHVHDHQGVAVEVGERGGGAVVFHPRQGALAQPTFSALGKHFPVKIKVRRRILLLLVPRQCRPGIWLRQPRILAIAETGMQLRRPPWQRPPAAVTAYPFSAGPGEGGVLTHAPGNVCGVRQPKLFPLVQIGTTGEAKHEHGGRGGPPSSEFFIGLYVVRTDTVAVAGTGSLVTESGSVPDDAVVGNHPRPACPHR